MFFDVVPNLLSSLITIPLPIFASYKALRTADPAQLAPWLMYFVILSLFALFESWTFFLLSWLPFYSFFRLAFLAYLVLPQTQGARLIYEGYVDPWLARHEAEIEEMIERGHERAKKAGLQYLKKALEYIKQNVLGMQPKAQAFPPKEGGRYAQSLLSRFYVPSARTAGPPSTTTATTTARDFYSLLSTAMGQMSHTGETADIIPHSIASNEDKMTFLATQRERLRALLSALDKEAWELGGNQQGVVDRVNEEAITKDVERRLGDELFGEGLRKRGSESEFDEIGREEAPDKGKVGKGGEGAGGSWMPWGWGTGVGKQTPGSSSPDKRL